MNVLAAGSLIDLKVLNQAAQHATDPAETAEIRKAGKIIEQLQLPWMATGQPTCRLCCESPADNNQLRTELLEARQQPTQAPLEHNELVAALAKANRRIAKLSSKIRQLHKEAA